jgi:hypothetical protein
MYQSNFTSPYCAAFQTWSGGVSRFVEGYEEVNAFIDSARGSFAKLHLFIDRETADNEYAAEVDRVYGSPFEWHRGVDGGLYEDYEQSIGE